MSRPQEPDAPSRKRGSGAVSSILSQHAEEAGFLWQLRDLDRQAINLRLDNLMGPDRFLHAHLESLSAASLQQLEGELSDFYVDLAVSLKKRDAARVDSLLEGVKEEPEQARAIAALLEWLEPAEVEERIKSLVGSKNAFRRCIGLLASAGHRRDLGPAAKAAIEDRDHIVRACAIRWAGELARKEFQASCSVSRRSSNPACRFWASWSGALLGDVAASQDLLAATRDYPENAELGIVTLVRAGKLAKLEALREIFGARTWTLIIGSAGDPSRVADLLGQMTNPALARSAGEAFALITGVDLAYEDLEVEAPADFEAGPNDDPEDENVALDPDENLPWPDSQKVEKWWGENRHRFQPGMRYLCGRPIHEETCWWVLENGFQRQRAAAAIELALLKPGRPLFNVKAPAWRQLDLIRRRKTA